MSNSDSGFIEIDGYKLHYITEGYGPNALVIGSAFFYSRSFSENLRKHLKITFLDWRGFSETESDSEISLDILLNDIDLIREKLGIKSCIIIGHSAHALLALEYAKKYPQYISHVVMIGISPNLSPEHASQAEKKWQEASCQERKAALIERIKQLPDEELAKLPPAERFVNWYVRRDPQGWYDFHFNSSQLWKDILPNMKMFDFLYGIALRDIDISKGLESFTKPVFIGLGQYDFIIAPPSSWDLLRPKFHNLTFRIFEKSGHSPQFEEVALFDEELLNWIGSS